MTEERNDGPFDPPVNWRRRIVLLTAATLLAIGIAWGTNEVLRSCGVPWSGVDKVGGECVGVTDGSYVFRPEFADVQRLIAEENARVRDEAPSYVTVALLDPLTPASKGVLPEGAIRHRLEGAYTALHRVNHTRVVGDPNLQIQLVLASEGGTEDQWQHVTDQLVAMSEREENPLVAVIGLGVSTQQTQQRANKLSEHGIPMVSSYLIADMLDYDNIEGLIRISPGNRQYVEALRSYVDALKQETDPEHGNSSTLKAVIVGDSNSKIDLFTQTLEKHLMNQMGDLIGDFPTVQYRGTGIPGEEVDVRLFSPIRANICAAAGNGLRAVLYAGREIDLGPFIESLEERPCLGTPLTILTAGLDLGEILEGREEDLRAAKLTVVVASTVYAEGWRKHMEENQNVLGTPASYDEFLSKFTQHGFDPEHLDGANAILMHDALLAAAKAVHVSALEGASPTANGVHTQLLNLHGEFMVPGASGTLSFSLDAPTGYPVGKPLPVLQYPHPANNPSRQVGLLYYVN